jgi:hypothetical protein
MAASTNRFCSGTFASPPASRVPGTSVASRAQNQPQSNGRASASILAMPLTAALWRLAQSQAKAAGSPDAGRPSTGRWAPRPGRVGTADQAGRRRIGSLRTGATGTVADRVAAERSGSGFDGALELQCQRTLLSDLVLELLPGRWYCAGLGLRCCSSSSSASPLASWRRWAVQSSA